MWQQPVQVLSPPQSPAPFSFQNLQHPGATVHQPQPQYRRDRLLSGDHRHHHHDRRSHHTEDFSQLSGIPYNNNQNPSHTGITGILSPLNHSSTLYNSFPRKTSTPASLVASAPPNVSNSNTPASLSAHPQLHPPSFRPTGLSPMNSYSNLRSDSMHADSSQQQQLHMQMELEKARQEQMDFHEQKLKQREQSYSAIFMNPHPSQGQFTSGFAAPSTGIDGAGGGYSSNQATESPTIRENRGDGGGTTPGAAPGHSRNTILSSRDVHSPPLDTNPSTLRRRTSFNGRRAKTAVASENAPSGTKPRIKHKTSLVGQLKRLFSSHSKRNYEEDASATTANVDTMSASASPITVTAARPPTGLASVPRSTSLPTQNLIGADALPAESNHKAASGPLPSANARSTLEPPLHGRKNRSFGRRRGSTMAPTPLSNVNGYGNDDGGSQRNRHNHGGSSSRLASAMRASSLTPTVIRHPPDNRSHSRLSFHHASGTLRNLFRRKDNCGGDKNKNGAELTMGYMSKTPTNESSQQKGCRRSRDRDNRSKTSLSSLRRFRDRTWKGKSRSVLDIDGASEDEPCYVNIPLTAANLKAYTAELIQAEEQERELDRKGRNRRQGNTNKSRSRNASRSGRSSDMSGDRNRGGTVGRKRQTFAATSAATEQAQAHRHLDDLLGVAGGNEDERKPEQRRALDDRRNKKNRLARRVNKWLAEVEAANGVVFVVADEPSPSSPPSSSSGQNNKGQQGENQSMGVQVQATTLASA